MSSTPPDAAQPARYPRLRPLPGGDRDHYCRLFPAHTGPPPSDQHLSDLALTMARDDSRIPDEDRCKRIPAAYTYLGQFIDHDLSYDKSPVPQTTQDPARTKNLRKNFLCLDNLYGAGPGSAESGNLYEGSGPYFKLGASLSNAHSFDVPLDQQGRPLTADPRNSENAIVRQVHALFLQLHNCAVAELEKERPRTATEKFVLARERVQHQYQHLVFHDFLEQVCHPEIVALVHTDPTSLIDWDSGFAIPAEFADAAFRFGHSMVRPGYLLGPPGEEAPVLLRDLFGGSHVPGALETRFAVNWDNFLAKSGQPEYAELIDTAVATDLFHLPPPGSGGSAPPSADSGPAINALAFRTLRRGAANELCSGQSARLLACPASSIRPPSSFYTYEPWQALTGVGLASDTPLWYYLLLEAQLNEGGSSLGTLGSLIVAGTIAGALTSNPASYLGKHGPGWQPDPWKTPHGKVHIRSFHDVALVVGLAQG